MEGQIQSFWQQTKENSVICQNLKPATIGFLPKLHTVIIIMMMIIKLEAMGQYSSAVGLSLVKNV